MTPAIDQTRLVASAAAGDEDAFRRLVEPEVLPSLRGARVVLGSDADAADAVQEALLIAWRKLGSLREPSSFAVWFRRIVVRETLRRARSRTHVVELDMAAGVGSNDLDQALEHRQLRRAFASLDGADRVLLTMRYLDGLTIREVAQVLGIPEGTVKSRTHQAMDRLRAAYNAEERR